MPSAKAPLPALRPTDSGARLPHAEEIDERDASAVAVEWARLAYGYDTVYDTHPHAGVLRASRYLTAEQRSAEREYTPASAAGAQWNTWSSHEAWTTAHAGLADPDEDAPADTAVLAYRTVSVEGTAHGRDGWRGPGPRLHAGLTLTRGDASSPWRISQVIVDQATD
ncbi:hypothetical protein [Streptomyces sp. NPDC018833]|uniref:hypothetical protein n=1 Tax=Streptomyces sp. NPDC018833 TaxID=3365053 RepID=UPI0037A26BEC